MKAKSKIEVAELLLELFEDAKHRLGANGTPSSEIQCQLCDTLIELTKEKIELFELL